MKSSTIHLFAFLLILTIQSCKSYSAKNDLEKMNLKGNVIGLLNEKNEFYFFNKDGFIEKFIQYFGSDREVCAFQDYIYVENLLNKTIGRLYISDFVDENILTNYIYNKDKQLIKTSSPTKTLGNTYKYFFYDKDGKLIKDSSVNIKQDVPEDIEVYKYTYLKDEVAYYEHIKNGYSEIAKFKDDFGEFYLSKKEIEFEFSTDNIGNWVEKKKIINRKSIVRPEKSITYTRLIFYSGEDISRYLDDYNRFKSSKSGSTENHNTEITTEKKHLVTCGACYGTGQKTCLECGGKGKTRCQSCIGQPRLKADLSYCSDCGGSQSQFCYRCVGDGIEGDCPICNGTGKLEE